MSSIAQPLSRFGSIFNRGKGIRASLAESLADFTNKTVSGEGGRINKALSKAMPNTHKNMREMFESGTTAGQNRATQYAAAMGLSALKGTRTAAKSELLDSLRKMRGLGSGSALGAGAGGGIGAATTEGDGKEKAKGALLGALIGATGGGSAGLGGTAAYRGGRAGLTHIQGRARGWDNLLGMGLMPKIMDETYDASALFRGGKMKGIGNVINRGDEAVVGYLSGGDNAGGQIFTGPFGRALRQARIRELDAGGIVNPDVANASFQPAIWNKLRKGAPDLERFYGYADGTESTLNLGNIRGSNAPMHSALQKLKASIDKRNLGSSSTTADHRSSLNNLSTAERRQLDLLDDKDLLHYLERARNEGNINVSRIWSNTPRKKQPFDIDLKGDLKAQGKALGPLQEKKIDGSADWREVLMDQEPSITREGIEHGSKAFNPANEAAVINMNRRLSRGEKVDVARELTDTTASSRSGLRSLFEPPPLFANAQGKHWKRLPDDEIQKARSRRAVRGASVDPSQFKRGDVFEIMEDTARDNLRRGERLDADFFKGWDEVEDAVRNKLAAEGVTGPAEWEAFKRLVVSAARKEQPMPALQKAASDPVRSFRLKWMVRRLVAV